MMTVYQRKLHTLASTIYCDLSLNDELHKGVTIKRHLLRKTIQSILKITSANAIGKWIDTLLSEDIISLNPHTSLSANKKRFKPSNDTRYFIDISKCKTLHLGLIAYKEKEQRERHMGNHFKQQMLFT